MPFLQSFYLPGSIGENDKQMVEQWNVSPPRIYLWSRQDWISKHKDIAQKQGHLGATHQEENHHFIGEEVTLEQEAPILEGGNSSRNNTNNSNSGKESQQQQVKPPSSDDMSVEEIMMPGISAKSPMAIADDEDDVGVDYAVAISGILEEINQQCDGSDNFEEEGTSYHDQQQQNRNKEAVSDADEKLWRDLDARTWVRLYGRQEAEPPSQRAVYPTTTGHSPIYSSSSSSIRHHVRSSPPVVVPPTYGRLNPGPEPSYPMMTSMLQRYAPRLDELNHPARVPNNIGLYEPRVPPQQHLGGGGGGVGGGVYHPPQGFASGPYRPPFPPSNSSGWLNE